MSTTAAASPTRRTSIVIVGPFIRFPPLVGALSCVPLGGRSGELADGAVEIGKELDEVRQPGDVEDLAVVGAQPAGDDLPAFGPRAGQHADTQRNAGGVDVIHRGEVEHHRGGPAVRPDGPLLRSVPYPRGRPVELPPKLDRPRPPRAPPHG